MGIVHLLLNPAANGRRRGQTEAAIQRAIQAAGHTLTLLRPPSPDLIATTIDEARHEDVTRLVIAGGDGLLHHALPAIAGSDIAVGVVPIGTGNDFARALALPTDVDGAVAAALDDPQPVDLITVEPPDDPPPNARARLAASVVTGGFSGRVTERANRLRFPPGQQRYTVATLAELWRLAPVELNLTIDGTRHELESSLFAIGNTRYFGGGMAICPDASPSDGSLDVTVVGPASRFELARVLPTVFSGRHVDHPSVTTHRARSVVVETPADLWADGEPFVSAPRTGDKLGTTTLSVTPGALRVAGILVDT